MEVTNCVFGEYYPVEIIEHEAFFRRRVRFENDTGLDNTLNTTTTTLLDSYRPTLIERLSKKILENRFLEVILNPCLTDKNHYRHIKRNES